MKLNFQSLVHHAFFVPDTPPMANFSGLKLPRAKATVAAMELQLMAKVIVLWVAIPVAKVHLAISNSPMQWAEIFWLQSLMPLGRCIGLHRGMAAAGQ